MTPILRMLSAIVSVRSAPRAFGRSFTSTMRPLPFAPYLRRTPVRCHRCGAKDSVRSTARLAELLGEFRQCLVEVGHQPIIGHLEDRRFLVLVDRHDHLGILHAGEMLDGARN